MYIYHNGCIPLIKATALTMSGTTLQITLPSNLSLLNGKKWKLIICENSPVPAGTIGDVVFNVNGTLYPAMNGIGNNLKTDMLPKRKPVTLIYGWDPKHFMVCGTCESTFVPTTAATVTPAVVNAVPTETISDED